jgi:HK97 family phage prohead protease
VSDEPEVTLTVTEEGDVTYEGGAVQPHIEDDAVALVERSEGDGDGRELLIRLVKWGEVAESTHEGIRETFVPGAFAGSDPTRVTIESQDHKRDLVGRGFALEEREDGAYLKARIARTHGGDDLLTLIKEGVLTAASVVFRPIASRRRADGVIERTLAELARVAILDRGAYPSSAVVSVRNEPEPPPAEKEAPPVDEPTTPETPAESAAPITPEPIAPESQEEPVPPTPEPMVERAAPDLSPVTSRLDRVEQQLAVISSSPALSVADIVQSELMSVPSLAEFIERAHHEDIVVAGGRPMDGGLRAAFAEFMARDLADQITGNNAGAVPAGWITDLKRLVDFGRPVINAFGGPEPLPATGMTVQWPYVSSSNVIIGTQATQKTEVTSARVDIGSDSSTIGTYAGASDVSEQLLRRSGGNYRAWYDRIMLAYWARVTDAAFAAALEAAGTAATEGWDADTTGHNLKHAIFAASVQVEDASGAPAQFALAATDVFTNLADLNEIVPASPPGNPSNATGTLDAGTLNVNVAGLPIIHARGLATGRVLVSNQLAADWLEDGPFSATAPDVALLGQNIAWFSFGAAATYIPAALVELFGPGATGS